MAPTGRRPRITTAERRARLAHRHAIAPASRAPDVVEAARSMVCLHATDPATVHLSAWARVDGLTTADVDRALYADRTLVKHLSMRRTLFVFPLDALAPAQAAGSDRVATAERKRLAKDVEEAGLHPSGSAWLAEAEVAVVEALAGGREASSTELRAELPILEGTIRYGEGKTWGGDVPIGPRVLTVLSADGQIVRGTNDGRWNVSRPRWSAMDAWLGAPVERLDAATGTAALVERWLRRFGPGTETDIKWWLGSTLGLVRAALADIEAVAVDLDDGGTGYVMPDDVDPSPKPASWTALLPPLDPTTMGWFERAWYLGDHKAQLFDTAGNAGPTAWVDGRIVGGWRQRDDASVELQILDDIPARARKTLDARAAELTEWLGGTRAMARFPSPLSKAIAES